MHSFFARRTSWDLATNRYTQELEAYRRAGREVLDLTASNPTSIGLRYREEDLLRSLSCPEALITTRSRRGCLRLARRLPAITPNAEVRSLLTT